MIIGVFLGSGVLTRDAHIPADTLAARFDADVQMIGVTMDSVAGIDPGETFDPEVTLADADPHVLVLPGGFGVRSMTADLALVGQIRRIAERCDGVMAISTGALLLASTGLLAGTPVSGHWLTAPELEPFDVTLSDRPFERHGRLFSAGGAIAAAEAMAVLADVILYGPN